MDQVTGQLAEFSLGIDCDRISDEVRHALKRHAIDSVGCALGAFDETPAQIARQIALICGGPSSCGVIGTSQRTSPDLAAFANGTMIRALDFNDTYPGGHPSDGLGAIFALAQAAGAEGARVLAASFILYEVFGALCDAVDFRERGWDQGTVLQIALACAAAPLLGLDLQKTANAIALAACDGPATRQSRAGRLSMWKGCAAPSAARNAVFLTQLAAAGLSGPDRAFDGRHGFFEQVSGGAFEPRLGGLGDASPAIKRTLLKFLPIETNIQSAANAALALRKELCLEDIASIRIETFWRSWHETGSEPAKWAPDSRETADHSMPFIVATILRDGGVSLDSFARDRLVDASLRAIMEKITIEHNPAFTAEYPEKMTTRIEVTARCGRSNHAIIDHPKGHVANPLTDDDVEAKFKSLAEQRLTKAGADELLAWLWRLEDQVSVDPLFVMAAKSRPC